MTGNDLSAIKLFLIDMDGTFYLGENLIDGALKFIKVLDDLGKDYIFLTNNSSKHRKQYVEKITRLGLPILENKVFTSGEATALFLKHEHPNSSIFVVGTQALENEFIENGFVLDDNHPDLVVLGFDTTLTYKKLWKLCDFVRSGLPYFATHPDNNCPTNDGFMPDIGAMIAFVRTSTGRDPDHIIGKPNRYIIDILADKLNFRTTSMCMIGDRLYTDIALNQTAGIPTILVLSGETHQEDIVNSPYKPTFIFNHLGELADYLVQTKG